MQTNASPKNTLPTRRHGKRMLGFPCTEQCQENPQKDTFHTAERPNALCFRNAASVKRPLYQKIISLVSQSGCMKKTLEIPLYTIWTSEGESLLYCSQGSLTQSAAEYMSAGVEPHDQPGQNTK